METGWQQEVAQVSPNEADQIVELWLRRRITGSEQLEVDAKSLSVPDLARALNLTDRDVLSLLDAIRRKTVPVKPRRAISVASSWRIIGAIYLATALGCFAFWRYAIVGYAPPSYGVPAYASYTHTGSTTAARFRLDSRLPRGMSVSYHGTKVDGGPAIQRELFDWDATKQTIVSVVQRMNDQATLVDRDLTPSEIRQALAGKDGSPKPHIAGTGYLEGPYLRWSPLTVKFEGNSVTANIPSPKVADSGLEKAVREYTESKVSKLMDVLENRSGGIHPHGSGHLLFRNSDGSAIYQSEER